MPGIIKNMIKEKTQNKLVQHINYNKKSEAEKKTFCSVWFKIKVDFLKFQPYLI